MRLGRLADQRGDALAGACFGGVHLRTQTGNQTNCLYLRLNRKMKDKFGAVVNRVGVTTNTSSSPKLTFFLVVPFLFLKTSPFPIKR